MWFVMSHASSLLDRCLGAKVKYGQEGVQAAILKKTSPGYFVRSKYGKTPTAKRMELIRRSVNGGRRTADRSLN